MKVPIYWKPLAALGGVTAAAHGYGLLSSGPDDVLAGHSSGVNLGYGQYGSGEDYLNNFDFNDPGGNPDWGVDIIYRSVANVQYVKDSYLRVGEWHYDDGEHRCTSVGNCSGSVPWPAPHCGSEHYEWLYGVGGGDTPGWFRDNDRGIKGPYCGTNDPGDQDYHMRLYADLGEDVYGQMYSLNWGYWVVATTHKDNEENCGSSQCNKWSGQNESSEYQFASQVDQQYPSWGFYYNCPYTYTYQDKNGNTYTAGRNDCQYLDNYDVRAETGDHWPYNTGYATHIWVSTWD